MSIFGAILGGALGGSKGGAVGGFLGGGPLGALAGGALGSAIGGDKKPAGSYSKDNISQGYADMLRSDYEDWQTRFKPYEALQRDFVLNEQSRGQLRDNALGYVDNGVNQALQRTTAGMNVRDRKYGVALDADEQASRQRRLGNKQSLLSAQGKTNMLNYLGQRDLQLLSGGVR